MTVLASILLLVALARAVSVESQLENASANRTLLEDTTIDGWVNDPSFRGTASILRSCIGTILACVYTAIHPNIRLTHASIWRRLLGKAKWTLFALFTPELVLHTAFNQYSKARKLRDHLKTTYEQGIEQADTAGESSVLARLKQKFGLSSSKSPKLKSKYNLTYAFWVVMGGFIIDIDDIHGDYNRVALTAEGFTFLTEHMSNIQCFELSKEQITDRSKASHIRKTLVLFQVGWMLLQAIDRLVAGYSLTLLELHTAVHVVCAFCIYLLWWEKPLDVAEPISVDLSEHKDLVAYLVMMTLPIEKASSTRLKSQYKSIVLRSSSWLPIERPSGPIFDIKEPERELLVLNLSLLRNTDKTEITSPLPSADVATVGSTVGESASMVAVDFANATEAEDSAAEKARPPIMVFGLVPVTSEPQPLDGEDLVRVGTFHKSGFGLDAVDNLILTPKGSRRWFLCSQAIRTHNLLSDDEGRQIVRRMAFKNGEDYCPMLNSKPTSGAVTEDSLSLSVALILLPVIYGALHLAAWNAYFPTPIESLLWKIAAIAVTSVGVVATIVLTLSSHAFELEFGRREPKPSKFVRILVNIYETITIFFATIFGILSVILVVVARLFLLVESFISLRQSPLGTFATTPWVQSIPHI